MVFSPLAKLPWLILVFLWALLVPGHLPWAIVALLLLSAFAAGVARRFVLLVSAFGVVVAFAAAAVTLAGFAGGTVYYSLWGVDLTSGKILQFSNTLGQLVAIVGAGYLFILTTDVEDFFQSLTGVGLSRPVALSLVGTLEALPLLKRRIDAVHEAQLSRGVPADGNLLERARSFATLLRPVLLSTIVEAADREVTLILRGFEASVPRQGPPVLQRSSDRWFVFGGLLLLFVTPLAWLLVR